jgi:hypothetical protein
MKVTMPSWHEDARRLRKDGHTIVEIQAVMATAGIEVSASRISQVTNERWEEYREMDQARWAASRDELKSAKKEGRLPDVTGAVRRVRAKIVEDRKAMSDRGFEPVASRGPDDVHHRVRIRCSCPGCEETLVFSRRGGAISPIHAARWFRGKGWDVAGKQGHDLCPTHFQTPHTKKKNGHANGHAEAPMAGADLPTTTEAVNDVTPEIIQRHFDIAEPPVAPAPAEMGRIDKRLIASKLEAVYIDENVGYKPGWSDKRVAKDLGAPKDWVTHVREDMFGPEIDMSSALRDEVNGISATIGAMIQDMFLKSDALKLLWTTSTSNRQRLMKGYANIKR